MQSEQKPDDSKAAAGGEPTTPAEATAADALERPTGESGPDGAAGGGGTPSKKPGGLKGTLKRFNLYLLIFIFVVAVAGIVAAVAYLNSKKTPKTPTVANQTLTQSELQQLGNSNASVGDTGQTLTIQGNAVVDGTMLVRSNLNVAGTIQLGDQLSVPNLTVSGTANLSAVQASSLQVAKDMTIQGQLTLQNGLDVSGSTSFSGPITAGQITVTKLIMGGNATLQIPNHISFTGPSASAARISGPVGSGGTVSINGSDTSGTLNVSTGNGTSPGCFATINFNQKLAGAPRIIITPVGAAAGATQFYVDNPTTSSFQICTANAAPANAELAYDFFVMD